MTFLYFIVDVCFYNFTSFKTDFLLHAILEKKEPKLFFWLALLGIDFLLNTHLKLFLLYLFLFFLNHQWKLSLEKRFLLNFLFYKIGVFLFFQTFFFDPWGFFITFLYLFISHKNKIIS